MGFWVVGVGRKGPAKRFHTVRELKGKRNSIVLPEKRGARRALTVPWMWWRGRTCRKWSEGLYSHACIRE